MGVNAMLLHLYPHLPPPTAHRRDLELFTVDLANEELAPLRHIAAGLLQFFRRPPPAPDRLLEGHTCVLLTTLTSDRR